MINISIFYQSESYILNDEIAVSWAIAQDDNNLFAQVIIFWYFFSIHIRLTFNSLKILFATEIVVYATSFKHNYVVLKFADLENYNNCLKNQVL